MTIDLGNKLRELRRKIDVTQEKLADYLGVTCQAVSRWESGNGYPDIECLPAIASFFSVTTDELLGADREKNEVRIKEYLEEFKRLKYAGDEKQSMEFIRRAFTQYPHDWRIIEKYSWQLAYDPNIDDRNGFKEHADELRSLCSRVLDYCTDDQKRYSALSILSGVYDALGDREKSLEYAMKFPDSYYKTSCEELEQFYKNHPMEQAYKRQLQENVHSLTQMLHTKIRNIALDTNDPDERIRLHRKSIELYELIFDGGNLNHCHFDVADAYFWIGNRYIEKGDYDRARDSLEKSVKHSISYDTLSDELTFTSPFLDTLTYRKTDAYRDFSSKCGLELEHYKDSFYDSVRHFDWFTEMISELEATKKAVTS